MRTQHEEMLLNSSNVLVTSSSQVISSILLYGAAETVGKAAETLCSIINKKYLLKAQSPIHVPNDAFLCIE